MMHDTTDRILVALFCLCRDTRPVDASTLGQATGHTPTQAAEALVALERLRWVDATRARLTMLGLARATQLAARAGHGHGHGGGGGLRLAAVNSQAQLAQRMPRTRIKPPVAARAVARRQAEAITRDSVNDRQQALLQHVAGASVSQ